MAGAQAEAFATLVREDSLSIQGAVKTICALLKSPDKRVAAITMMGKTAELCYNKVLPFGLHHRAWLC